MVGLGQKFLLVSRAQVHARALVLVPGVPVRALARLAAKSRDTFTQLEAVAAAAIGERRRRVRSGFAAHRAGPLPEHIRANCPPSAAAARKSLIQERWAAMCLCASGGSSAPRPSDRRVESKALTNASATTRCAEPSRMSEFRERAQSPALHNDVVSTYQSNAA